MTDTQIVDLKEPLGSRVVFPPMPKGDGFPHKRRGFTTLLENRGVRIPVN
jgi:hypothetical protein